MPDFGRKWKGTTPHILQSKSIEPTLFNEFGLVFCICIILVSDPSKPLKIIINRVN